MNVLLSYCMRECLADNWLHYADIYPNDMDVLFFHSGLNVLITSVYYEDFWEEAVIISCTVTVYFCFMIRSSLNQA